jgi:hypothetical protein
VPQKGFQTTPTGGTNKKWGRLPERPLHECFSNPTFVPEIGRVAVTLQKVRYRNLPLKRPAASSAGGSRSSVGASGVPVMQDNRTSLGFNLSSNSDNSRRCQPAQKATTSLSNSARPCPRRIDIVASFEHSRTAEMGVSVGTSERSRLEQLPKVPTPY